MRLCLAKRQSLRAAETRQSLAKRQSLRAAKTRQSLAKRQSLRAADMRQSSSMMMIPILILILCFGQGTTTPSHGGLSVEKPATADIQMICNKIRADVEGKLGGKQEVYKAASYKTQVVAGTNYFVKIQVDNGYIHARIFQALPHVNKGPELHSIQEGKEEGDSLDYF